MNWKRAYDIKVLIFLVVLTGCNSSSERSLNQADIQALTMLSADQKRQKELAIKAKDKLFESLLGELTKSMEENGPAKSVNVCKSRAPEISAAIGKEHGVRIGRTSLKLRNLENQPPPWATRFVADKVEKPTEVALPENGLGVLLPIRLKATCTLCHGYDDQVTPEVRAAIVSNYPNDAATGFAEDDLRGYFWVEVPSMNH